MPKRKFVMKKEINKEEPLDIATEIKRLLRHAERNFGPSGIEALTEIEFLITDMKRAMGGD